MQFLRKAVGNFQGRVDCTVLWTNKYYMNIR